MQTDFRNSTGITGIEYPTATEAKAAFEAVNADHHHRGFRGSLYRVGFKGDSASPRVLAAVFPIKDASAWARLPWGSGVPVLLPEGVMKELVERSRRAMLTVCGSQRVQRDAMGREIRREENSDWSCSGRVDRNRPCPCGSGVKFKKCCLDASSMNGGWA